MAELDPAVRAFFEAPNFITVSTVRPDGTVLSVPVWGDLDGDEIVVNSSEGRAWPDNLRRTGHATLTVSNPENPYEYVSVTARLSGDDHASGDAVIDALAKKYMGVDEYPFRRAGEQRVTLRLTPERVYHMVPPG